MCTHLHKCVQIINYLGGGHPRPWNRDSRIAEVLGLKSPGSQVPRSVDKDDEVEVRAKVLWVLWFRGATGAVSDAIGVYKLIEIRHLMT